MLPLYTGDIETDPFARGKVPEPFLIGLYDGIQYKQWGRPDKQGPDYTINPFLDYCDDNLEPGIIYFHNGGRFDFFFMLPGFEGRTTIINSRIVCAQRPSQHNDGDKRFDKGYRMEFRDSFAIMPFPLRAYQKDAIDMDKLKRAKRKKHWQEISDYLRGDCTYLWELCMGFQREFGDYKTIASAAFAQLKTFHNYESLNRRTDEQIRKSYYFGGRVQCFSSGVLETPVTIYDVNSMYPFVMESYLHPTGWPVLTDNKVRGWNPDGSPNKEKTKTFFVTAEGENNGAFPTRLHSGEVDFTQPSGIFSVTIHEYLTALELGLFKPTRIIEALSFSQYSQFHQFVTHFYSARKEVTAKMAEHKQTCEGCNSHPPRYCPTGSDYVARSMYYKYVLNSAYGKFGLNPENYYNWQITRTNEHPEGEGWTLDAISQDNFYVWKQPTQTGSLNLKNIGTAASITGAARSILLRAIALSQGVLYCDTDSIICNGLGTDGRIAIDEKTLGAWKPEGTGAKIAIAGKKMYAVFDTDGNCIKHANKGVVLDPEQIERVARGENILWFRDAPTFSRDGSAMFMSRTARNTVKNAQPAPHVEVAS